MYMKDPFLNGIPEDASKKTRLNNRDANE